MKTRPLNVTLRWPDPRDDRFVISQLGVMGADIIPRKDDYFEIDGQVSRVTRVTWHHVPSGRRGRPSVTIDLV